MRGLCREVDSEGMSVTFFSADTRQAAVKVGTGALLGFLPLFALALVVGDLLSGDAGWAFREAFLGAADDVLDGSSPYPVAGDPDFARGTAYVYPPVLAFATIPFTVVSTDVAVGLFALVLIASVPATLWLCGVRDWRCYGIAFLWPAVLSGVHVENISLLMALGGALVWRYRDRPALSGASLGVAMAVKPLLWPVGLWLLATGRLRSLLSSVAVAVTLALVSWAAIGFAGLRDYPALLRRLSAGADEWGYSLYALLLDLGAGHSVARALWALLAVAVLAAAVVIARRGDDRSAFVLAMAAVIAVSPIVWLHYFSLLLVVVAVAQPRLGLVWFVPLLMWGSEEITNGTTFQTALTLAAAALTVVLALRAAPVTRLGTLTAVRSPSPPLGESP
jgi:Glycosyltransferase family 87